MTDFGKGNKEGRIPVCLLTPKTTAGTASIESGGSQCGGTVPGFHVIGQKTGPPLPWRKLQREEESASA